jgi:hypothetical protein
MLLLLGIEENVYQPVDNEVGFSTQGICVEREKIVKEPYSLKINGNNSFILFDHLNSGHLEYQMIFSKKI